MSAHERLLRDFSCGLCKGVLAAPLSMPCGHTFCKPCLDGHFTGPDVVQNAARSLRIRKVCWSGRARGWEWGRGGTGVL